MVLLLVLKTMAVLLILVFLVSQPSWLQRSNLVCTLSSAAVSPVTLLLQLCVDSPAAYPLDLRVGMMRRFEVTKSDVVALKTGESRSVSVRLRTEEDKDEVRENNLK